MSMTNTQLQQLIPSLATMSTRFSKLLTSLFDQTLLLVTHREPMKLPGVGLAQTGRSTPAANSCSSLCERLGQEGKLLVCRINIEMQGRTSH